MGGGSTKKPILGMSLTLLTLVTRTTTKGPNHHYLIEPSTSILGIVGNSINVKCQLDFVVCDRNGDYILIVVDTTKRNENVKKFRPMASFFPQYLFTQWFVFDSQKG